MEQSTLDTAVKMTRALGWVVCASRKCTFHNQSQGCFLAAGVSIKDGSCEYYTTTPASVIFPKMVIEKD